MESLKNVLPVEIKRVWYWSTVTFGIFWLVANVILLTVTLILKWPLWIFGVSLFVFICSISFELWLVAYRYHFYSYQITPEQIIIQNGFIFRKRILIPMARIQHVLVEQGPFLRRQSLVKVGLVTAADEHHIEAVRANEAEELQQYIMNLVQVAKDDL